MGIQVLPTDLLICATRTLSKLVRSTSMPPVFWQNKLHRAVHS